MATDDDTLAWARPKSSLPTGRARGKPQDAEPEEEADSWPADDFDPLPTPGSPYDTAHSRPANKPQITLHVLFKDGYSKGYAWSNFDSVDTASGGPSAGPILLVRFAGLVPTELRIAGRNLGKLLVDIGRHRIAWIREQPSKRGFDGKMPAADEPETIITGIDAKPWEP